MADKLVVIKDVTVEALPLYQAGTESDLFQDVPVTYSISPKDFEDAEDYRTVIRLLTKVCKKKLNAHTDRQST